MELEEFLEKYGHIEVEFSHYYKYTFTFSATLEDGSTLFISYGESSDDIYRYSVTAGSKIDVRDFHYAVSGSVVLDGKTIESFDNW